MNQNEMSNGKEKIMTLNIDYTDKIVVVIGGTSGINRGIAELFAEHGANVAVASRNRDKVDNTVSSLKKFGVKAMGFSWISYTKRSFLTDPQPLFTPTSKSGYKLRRSRYELLHTAF